MAMPMDTDKRVAPPILLVCCFKLKNLRRYMCYRAILSNSIGSATCLLVSIGLAILCLNAPIAPL